MGQPKLLLPLQARAVIRHAVERALAGGLGLVVVVTGHEHARVEAALVGLPVRLARNPEPEAGLAGSIRIGIEALPSGTEAALILLGDQPALDTQVIPALLAEWRAGRKAVVAPRYREGLGNPVLFGASVFPELVALAGDRGARAVVERDPGRLATVDLDLPRPADLDTREDYDRLRPPGEPV
jgi:molybdenum cofactor cytidylyltransferase